MAMNRNCARAEGLASAIQLALPLLAPNSGSTLWLRAMASARISANWPISGIIA